MKLGTFSLSLAVEDLAASRDFYRAFGFEALPAKGDGEAWSSYGQDWLILVYGSVRIGLFQGMFEQNILTFNPPDVREVQRRLKAAGIDFTAEADESSSGPASAMLTDPDGNPILLDQHND